jgi:DNA-binding LytR/AlgR family response regulator
MLSVIIIEDELIASEYLEKMIHQYDPTIKVIAKIDSVESAVQFLTNHTADLIFCDIHLSDDISFTIFNRIDVTIPVIFTTAYDQYAIRAFKFNSIDYLLKPINKEELFAAITKFETGRKDNFPDLKNMLAHFTQQTNYQQRFLVSSGSKLKSVAIEDVAYFYADQKLNFLVENSGKQFIIDHALDKLEPMLHPNDFFRINRQFIIRFSSITSMTAYSKSRIKIELTPACDKETIVSVDRSPEFKAWLNR